MSINRGPNIVTDGLVFGYDADERSTRFYKGEPTTNISTRSEEFAAGSEVNSNGTWAYNQGSIINSSVTPENSMFNNAYLVNLTSNVWWDIYRHYNGLTPGLTYTFSMYVKLGSATNFCIVVNNAQNWNTLTQYSKVFTTSDGLNTTEYKRVSITFVAPSTTAVNIHLGGHSENLTQQTPGTVYITGTQFEQKPHPTQYIRNTTLSTVSRDSNQSLIDLKKTTSIDLSNVSFDWKGDPYFYKSGNNIISINTYPIVYTNFSVEAWIFLNGFDSNTNVGQVIAEQYSANSGWIFSLVGSSAYLELRNHNNGVGAYNLIYGTSLNIGKWYHVAASDDGTTVRLFIDGNVVASTNSSTTTGAISTPMRIGSFDTGYGVFSGKIKSLKLYNNALTPSEMLQNYNASKGRFEEENNLNSGLVLHLDANNKNSFVSGSTTWYDLAGSNNGVIYNVPTYEYSNDGILTFNGTDEFVELPHLTITNQLTFGGWIKIQDNGWNPLVGNWQDSGNGDSWLLTAYNNLMQFYAIKSTGGNVTVSDSSSMVNNTWYYFIATFNNGVMKLYRNGIEVSSGNLGTTSLYQNTLTTCIGRFGVQYTNGSIGNVKVWNRVLTSQEIQTIFNNEKSRYGL